jgi:hypothetical protein
MLHCVPQMTGAVVDPFQTAVWAWIAANAVSAFLIVVAAIQGIRHVRASRRGGARRDLLAYPIGYARSQTVRAGGVLCFLLAGVLALPAQTVAEVAPATAVAALGAATISINAALDWLVHRRLRRGPRLSAQ